MGHLLMRLQKTGVAKKALVIKVAANGTLTFKGPQELTASNPTIQVLFQNNHADVRDQVRLAQPNYGYLKKRLRRNHD
ncbi:alpha/beta hydrolase [Latilactobacillus sakei]